MGQIELANYIGKKNVVLALYFAAFTPVWTDELKDFQRDLKEFEDLDAQIIGVSGDSLETNAKFTSQNGIKFPLITDTGKAIKKKYGRGRVTYLIDKSGTIQFVQKGVPDNQEFIDRLKKMKQ